MILVSLLAADLAGIGVYAWYFDTGTTALFVNLGIGIVLAVIYLIRGGTLPEILQRRMHIHREDDPGNISPRVYLPILVVAIIIAALLFKFGVKR